MLHIKAVLEIAHATEELKRILLPHINEKIIRSLGTELRPRARSARSLYQPSSPLRGLGPFVSKLPATRIMSL